MTGVAEDGCAGTDNTSDERDASDEGVDPDDEADTGGTLSCEVAPDVAATGAATVDSGDGACCARPIVTPQTDATINPRPTVIRMFIMTRIARIPSNISTLRRIVRWLSRMIRRNQRPIADQPAKAFRQRLSGEGFDR